MKDFSPHAILRPPSIPDEEVENLIRLSLTSLGHVAPVVLLIEPPGPWTRRNIARAAISVSILRGCGRILS